MTIRSATPEDAEAVAALRAAVAAEGKWIGTEAPVDLTEAADKFAELLADDDNAAFAATAGDAVIGIIMVYPERPGVTTLGMFVDAAHRGTGVGRQLLTAAVDWSRDNGAHKVSLQVWLHNRAAIALYSKLGFTIEGLLRRHARRTGGELWDIMVMGLVLDTTSPGSSHS